MARGHANNDNQSATSARSLVDALRVAIADLRARVGAGDDERIDTLLDDLDRSIDDVAGITRNRPSSLDRMPPELQDVFRRLVRQGRTIQEITDALNALDAGVSKSAVGRAVKDAREEIADYKAAQEVAGQWVAQIGETPNGDIGMLLAELLKMIALETLRGIRTSSKSDEAAGIKGKAPKPMDIMLLAKAIRDLEATAKASMERQEKIERAAIERAAKKAGEVGERVGLSQATIEEIQKELRLL